MSNFSLDSKAIRKLIKDNLDEKYKSGFPIVKELIQNANDAKAESLYLGWCKGISDAEHPLLRETPGVFVINDGIFTKKDRMAIHKIWSNFKDTDSSSIGKFGLGLKSVFHLCDAFFYFASDVKGDQNGEKYKFDILNPWEDEDKDFHPEWKNLSDTDYENMKEYLNLPLKGLNRWFCVWIPLRNKKLSGKHYIRPIFPGDDKNPPEDEFFVPNLNGLVSQILPMLNPLERVSCWFEDETGKLVEEFQINRSGASLRNLKSLKNLSDSTIKEFSGDIQETLIYAGIDKTSNDPELKEYFDSDSWPADDEKKKEPAFQHSAVCFMKYPPIDGKSTLSIHWAVFLPLSDEEDNELTLQGVKSSFNLTLHGWYFIDSGRRRIEFDSTEKDRLDDTAKLRLKWNKRLAEVCMLPLIIPSLEKFADTQGLAPQEIYTLTKAIKNSKLFQRWSDTICKEEQWISKITEDDGRCISQWKVVPARKSVYHLPKPDDKKIQNDLFYIFPILTEFARKYCLTFEDEAFLSASDLTKKWPEKMLLSLLEIEVGNILQKQEYLEYWIGLWNINAFGFPKFTQRLSEFLSDVFRDQERSRLEKWGMQ